MGLEGKSDRGRATAVAILTADGIQEQIKRLSESEEGHPMELLTTVIQNGLAAAVPAMLTYWKNFKKCTRQEKESISSMLMMTIKSLEFKLEEAEEELKQPKKFKVCLEFAKALSERLLSDLEEEIEN